MKKLFFTILAASFIAVSCNSGADQAAKAKQDSLDQVAAADSMLNAAMATDSLIIDTVTVDSIQ